MKRVVSISLGSSSRDKSTEAEFLGVRFRLERIGTDGNLVKAADLIHELDGRVDCIGLGGMDRYLWLGPRKYAIRQVERLARKAMLTPIVDGSGLKNTLEPEIIWTLAREGRVAFADKQVLMVSGVDRFGMAQVFPELGCRVIYGDMIFALGLPIPLRSIFSVNFAGRMLLPIICWMPMSFLYPTGQKQQQPPSKRKQRWFLDADIIAGDWHFMRRYLPDDLQSKVIITNTTTQEDIRMLTERGAKALITTTPRIAGRSFGTNVMEGVLVALSGRRPEELTKDDYLDFIRRLDWKPSLEKLASI